ncbi:hypothetical protein D3C78_1503110 [compost metagenome]
MYRCTLITKWHGTCWGRNTIRTVNMEKLIIASIRLVKCMRLSSIVKYLLKCCANTKMDCCKRVASVSAANKD